MALFGDFESVSELSQTGFTTLLLARRAGTDEQARFVVKTNATPAAVVSDGAASNQAESFLEAAKLQATISDRRAQYWAPIHGQGMARGEPFYITDYYPRSAHNIVSSRTRIGPRQLHAIIDAVVRGLADFKTICRRPHGNLKPTNVLLTGEKNSDIPKTFLVDPCPTEQLAADAGDEVDLQAVGQLIFQMVTHREAPKIATWPLEMPKEFKRLGRKGPMWIDLVNKLLSPIDPARYTKLEDVLPVLPKLRVQRTGRMAAVMFSLAAIGTAAFMMHWYKVDPRALIVTNYEKVKAWVLRTPATQPVGPVVVRSTTGPVDVVTPVTQPTTRAVATAGKTDGGPATREVAVGNPTTREIAGVNPTTREVALGNPTTQQVASTTNKNVGATTRPAEWGMFGSMFKGSMFKSSIDIDLTRWKPPETRPIDKTVLVSTTQPATKPTTEIVKISVPEVDPAVRLEEIRRAGEDARQLLARLDGGASVASVEKELSALKAHKHAAEIKTDLLRVEARLDEFKAVEAAKDMGWLVDRIQKTDDVVLGMTAYRRLNEVERPLASLDEDYVALQKLQSRVARVLDLQRQRELTQQLAAESKLHWIDHVSSLKTGQRLQTALERRDAYKVTPAEVQDALRASAEKGSVAAPWALVELARDTKDPVRARHWLGKAAEAKHPKALAEMGLLLLNGGEGVQKDEAKAAAMLQEAVAKGVTSVAMPLAEFYIEGRGGRLQDLTRAAPLLRMAADTGNTKAQRMYAQLLLNELGGVRKDEMAGARYLREAAEKGDAEAMLMYVGCLQEGRGVGRDPAEAIKWLERAADAGNMDAVVLLADAHRIGKGVRKDAKRAFELFTKAAEVDNVPAMVRLAYLYESAQGTTRDVKVAVAWYERAARTGDKEANYALGYAYTSSPWIRHDVEAAIPYLEAAAQKGHKGAMKELAKCYRQTSKAEKAAYWEERGK